MFCLFYEGPLGAAERKDYVPDDVSVLGRRTPGSLWQQRQRSDVVSVLGRRAPGSLWQQRQRSDVVSVLGRRAPGSLWQQRQRCGRCGGPDGGEKQTEVLQWWSDRYQGNAHTAVLKIQEAAGRGRHSIIVFLSIHFSDHWFSKWTEMRTLDLLQCDEEMGWKKNHLFKKSKVWSLSTVFL